MIFLSLLLLLFFHLLNAIYLHGYTHKYSLYPYICIRYTARWFDDATHVVIEFWIMPASLAKFYLIFRNIFIIIWEIQFSFSLTHILTLFLSLWLSISQFHSLCHHMYTSPLFIARIYCFVFGLITNIFLFVLCDIASYFLSLIHSAPFSYYCENICKEFPFVYNFQPCSFCVPLLPFHFVYGILVYFPFFLSSHSMFPSNELKFRCFSFHAYLIFQLSFAYTKWKKNCKQ